MILRCPSLDGFSAFRLSAASGKLPTLAFRRIPALSDTATPAPQTLAAPLSVSEPCRLPGTMAGLLEAAINDARALDRDTYLPYSEYWHFITFHDVCQVCLAGSLIAVSLKNSPRITIDPDMFSDDTEDKLHAVEAMRTGDWAEAFRLIYSRTPYAELYTLLQELAKPKQPHFLGWKSFNAHLDSLESILPELRQVDELAAQLS